MRVYPCFLLMRPYLSGLKKAYTSICAVRTNVPHKGKGLCGDVLGIVLRLLCDAHPYRAQKTHASTIASPRHASILRRTRDHASGAGLSASMRNGVGASDKLRLVLPNTTLSSLMHAIVLPGSGVTIQKHLRNRTRSPHGPAVALRKRKRLGDQRAFRVRCEAVSQMQNEVGDGEQIGAWRPRDSGCALCLPVGDASFGRGSRIILGEAIWRTGSGLLLRVSCPHFWCPD
jgi:hypothetical protein